MNEKPLPPVSSDLEEMTASVDVHAGALSFQASAQATPAGLVGIALVLPSAAVLVWAVRCRPADGSAQ